MLGLPIPITEQQIIATIIDEGRFYCFGNNGRTTEHGMENDGICKRADAKEYFLAHWGAE